MASCPIKKLEFVVAAFPLASAAEVAARDQVEL